MIRDLIWRATTSVIADTIALWDPQRAAAYRANRERYRAYAAGTNKGAFQLWNPTNRSGQSEVAGATSKARAKMRDLERNNPIVAGIVRKRTTMVVGDWIGCKPLIRDDRGVPQRLLNAAIEERFYTWADTAGADGCSLTELVQLIENHLTVDGEIMAKDVVTDGTYRIQLLEADYLNTGAGQNGITYDTYGKPVTFHVYRSHPGDVSLAGKATSLETADVPASEIHWFSERSRASQHRGISPLVSAVTRLYGLDDLEDAELIAARSSAAYGVIITSPSAGDMPWNTYADGSTTATDDNSKQLEYLESGGILRLSTGETAQSFKSERPNSNFDSFHRGRLRSAAGSTGLSYESATGDYSQVNYSSARMGRIVEWAGIKREQARLIRWLNRVYRKWLQLEIAAGRVEIAAEVYTRNPYRLAAVSWQLAGNDSIDPVKEIETAVKEVALGVNSRTRYAAERGRDFAEIVAQLQEEKAALEAAGLYQEDPLVETSETVASTEETSNA